jgi:pimeloyl-ACP methyl ester carboxylesterase
MPALASISRGRGLALAVLLGLVAGAAWAWLLPRGPVTGAHAVASLAAGLLLGIAAGFMSGTRWGGLAAAIGVMASFEVVRLLVVGVTGPTVEAVSLGSTYGIIAFALGRGVAAVLMLAPILVGAPWGVEAARRLGHPRAARLRASGWIGAVAGTAALVAVGVAFAGGGSTPAIFTANGEPLPGSVAEIVKVPIGGHDQALMIRGRSTDNPVLLHLAGGPGGTDLGAMRADVSLEQDFVVATWDQRGVGKSYPALDPVSTLTLDSMVSDTLEVTDYLRDRFGQDRIYLAGNSWGTILGVLAVQREPDRYLAFVGTGQMVSPRETDRMFWEDTLAWAERTGNADLAATLRRNGPPPYADLLAYEPAIAHEHDWNPYPELDLSREMPGNLFVPENDLMDRINGLRSFLDTFSVLYPQLQDLDLRQSATRLEVPVYMAIGAHEARGRAVLADEWFSMLDAPSKERVVFEHSGHRPQFEEPAAFADLMRRVVADTGDPLAIGG